MVKLELPDDPTPIRRASIYSQWRRENPTTKGRDYTIVDGIPGRGADVWTFLNITALERYWSGEGEVKFYIDGDQNPTICGTGTEDYAGGAWAFQDRFRPPSNRLPSPSAPRNAVTHLYDP